MKGVSRVLARKPVLSSDMVCPYLFPFITDHLKYRSGLCHTSQSLHVLHDPGVDRILEALRISTVLTESATADGGAAGGVRGIVVRLGVAAGPFAVLLGHGEL